MPAATSNLLAFSYCGVKQYFRTRRGRRFHESIKCVAELIVNQSDESNSFFSDLNSIIGVRFKETYRSLRNIEFFTKLCHEITGPGLLSVSAKNKSRWHFKPLQCVNAVTVRFSFYA